MIKVSDRYPCPGPRYKRLGPSSGEEFREWLLKELSRDHELEVNLDDTEGFGSSFLEEAFGGLVREGVSMEIIKGIKFVSDEEPELIEEIQEYIDDELAKRELKNG